MDQYGKEIVAPAAEDVKIENATLNGMPLKATEIEYENGIVTLKTPAKKGDTIAFDLIANDTTSSFEYDDISDEEAAIKRVDIEVKSGEKVVEGSVPANTKLTLSAAGFDQYNNPVKEEDKDKYRWVITKDGKPVDAELKDLGTVTWTPSEKGEYTVVAYSTVDSKVKGSATVVVGHAELNELTVTAEEKLEGNNQEAIKLGTIAPNTGAVLTPEMITFEVKDADGKVIPTDKVADFVDVTAKTELVGEEENAKEEIVMTATTKQAGKYTITPVVQVEGKDKPLTGKSITIETAVKSEITQMSTLTFDKKELKVGKEIKKEIVFKNKYDEVVLGDKETVNVTSSNKDIKASLVTETDEKGNKVQYIKVKAEKEGTTLITIQAGDVISEPYKLTFEASELKTIDAGDDVTGVVAGDSEDKAVYNPLTFADQDGLEVSKPESLQVLVTDAKGETVTEDLAEIVTGTIDKEGKFTEDGENAKDYVKVLPSADLEEGTYTVTIATALEDGKVAKDAVSDSFKVEVGAVRDVKEINVQPTATTVALGSKGTFTIDLKDQYGDVIKAQPTVTEVIAEGEEAALALGDVSDSDTDGKYTFTAKGLSAGDHKVIVSVPTKVKAEDSTDEAPKFVTIEKEVTVTVGAGASLVTTGEITGDNIKDGEAQYQYAAEKAEGEAKAIQFVAKDAEGNVINIDQNSTDIVWKSTNEEAAKVVNGKVVTGTVEQDTPVTLTVDYFGDKASIDIVVSKAPAKAQKETLKAEIGEGEDKVDVTKAIVLDNETAPEGKLVVTFTATDQYGEDVSPTAFNPLQFANTELATVAQEGKTNKVIIEAKKAGTAELRAVVDLAEVKIPVTIKADAVQNKQDADALDEAVTAIEKIDTVKAGKIPATQDEATKAVQAAVDTAIKDKDTKAIVEPGQFSEEELRGAQEAEEELTKYKVTLKKGNVADRKLNLTVEFELTEEAQKQAAIEEAQEAVDKAKTELAKAKDELGKLGEQPTGPSAEQTKAVTDAQAELDKANNAVTEAEAKLVEAKKELATAEKAVTDAGDDVTEEQNKAVTDAKAKVNELKAKLADAVVE